MPDSQPIRIIEADLSSDADAQAVVAMIDHYAADPMGQAAPLGDALKQRILEGLRETEHAVVFLAQTGDGEGVGIAVCFMGFSTFKGRPLINIHDLAVHSDHRRKGIAQELLAAVEAKAKSLGCCRITLEVRKDNPAAQALYENAGFSDGETPMAFLGKPLAADWLTD